MSDTVIRVENLSKRYTLGRNGNSDGLRHVIDHLVTTPLRWLKKAAHATKPEAPGTAKSAVNGRKPAEPFWALKNVSFEVKQGEVVGIIGRNGAGKSTLLKILSRITEPTEGRIEITGRVASLLEVGTGFHAELTGRENIFLNGAILGMSRGEIKRKFDEIVAFAEVEKFLETPVKRYSSGMYVRLAFAVAAHLEPEILIVDEVLAVGDTEFQKKCLGKMQDVATREGRTVLFVSHNLSAIASLCQRGVLLQGGRLIAFDDIHTCIEKYNSKIKSNGSTGSVVNKDGYGFLSVTVADINKLAPVNGSHHSFTATDSVELVFECHTPVSSSLVLGFTLFNAQEVGVMSASSSDLGYHLPGGRCRIAIPLPLPRLPTGDYRVEAALWDSSSGYAQSDLLASFSLVNTIANRAGIPPRGTTLLECPWCFA